jgi:hypothetical protein
LFFNSHRKSVSEAGLTSERVVEKHQLRILAPLQGGLLKCLLNLGSLKFDPRLFGFNPSGINFHQFLKRDETASTLLIRRTTQGLEAKEDRMVLLPTSLRHYLLGFRNRLLLQQRPDALTLAWQ